MPTMRASAIATHFGYARGILVLPLDSKASVTSGPAGEGQAQSEACDEKDEG